MSTEKKEDRLKKLEETLQSHPVLSHLNISNYQRGNSIFYLHASQLAFSQKADLYIIGEKELRDILKYLCSHNDAKGIHILLSFDYSATLCKLKNHDPFYLEKNPFSTDFILDLLHEANYIDKKEVSLCLQRHIDTWLKQKIDDKGELISDDVCYALNAVSVYQPELAHARLVQELGTNFKFTKEIYNHDNYSILLDTLENMATEPQYFEFCVKHLLLFARAEVKQGVYHGKYKALHRLNALFRNACARTKVNLQARKEQLEKLITEADDKKDYASLYILMKVLGMAGNAFESGEHKYVEDQFYESYIHFSIEVLMRYAGIDDEDGLCLTAEEELHEILKCTVDEPEIWGASNVPFRILRFFLEYKREWNLNPFYHLNNLEDFIKFCKEEGDADQSYIHQLEYRLQQLISLVGEREFLSEDFILHLSSKYPQKICEIGIEPEPISKLELHARQSLAERLICVGKSNIHDIQRGWPKTTYVIANFGMVVSNVPVTQGIESKRIFKTIPIKVINYTITGRKEHYNGHAEEALYDHLLEDENILTCLNNFKNQFGINAPNHKVYAIVLDLHGTYDMCLSCSEKGLAFQDKFREKLLNAFQAGELITLKKYPHQLPIVIRYSSDLHYHYSNSTDNQKRGVLTLVASKGTKRDLGYSPPENQESPHMLKRDIKHYGANLLIHGKANWHSFWSKPKCTEYKDKPVKLESWSAFTTDRQINSLNEQERRINYTQLGQVETNSSNSSNTTTNNKGLN